MNPAMAETTTTGRKSRCNFTIAATLRNASVSSTEVPPNFMMVGFITFWSAPAERSGDGALDQTIGGDLA